MSAGGSVWWVGWQASSIWEACSRLCQFKPSRMFFEKRRRNGAGVFVVSAVDGRIVDWSCLPWCRSGRNESRGQGTGSRSRRGSSGKSRRRRGGGSGSTGGGHFLCPRGCWRPPDEGRAGPLIAVLALWIRQGRVVRRSTAWLLRHSTSQGLLPERGEGFRLRCDVVLVMKVLGRGFFSAGKGEY